MTEMDDGVTLRGIETTNALEGERAVEMLLCSSLADGGTCAGHVGEDAVVLVRERDQFFALYAVCTHYGAPLAEGALVGETIRCRWNHVCFGLQGAPLPRAAMRHCGSSRR